MPPATASCAKLANTFWHLGPHRDTIRLAHECRVHPRFYRGLGRDPEAATAAGIVALRQLYPATGATKMPAATKAVRTPKYRTFTVAQIEEASDQQCGFCLACGAMQENCELTRGNTAATIVVKTRSMAPRNHPHGPHAMTDR